jgi:AmmeMemoRadiSam system protein B
VGQRDEGRDLLGPTVAGTWYPSDASALLRQVQSFCGEGGSGTASALVVPHAGYVYSGAVAGRGFERLDPEARRVLLLGPSHYESFEGVVCPRAAVYRTPLGQVPIDPTAIAALRAAGVAQDDRPFRPEHCLEAEIPFLQWRLRPGWQLVPLLVGRLGGRWSAARLAETLRPLLGRDASVVVSSDFTHFGTRFDYVPFTSDVPEGIERLDRGAIEHILAWDATGFEEYVSRTGTTICGRYPIRVLFDLFPEGLEGRLVAYDTSGRITGDWDHSVSYASLAFGEQGAA